MHPFLAVAAMLAFLVGLGHSILGERYILIRMFRRPLPPLFGSDKFTRRTVRFAWHVTTILLWGMAAVMLSIGGGMDVRIIVVTTLLAMGALTVAIEWRHISWVIEVVMAGLVWAAR